MRSLHESPAKIEANTENGVRTTYLTHFLDLGRTVKYPLQKLLRISFFVALFVRKMMATKKKRMFLSLIALSLTMDFMKPSNIWMIGNILDHGTGDNASTAVGRARGTKEYICPLAFTGWMDVSAHHDNLTNYFRNEKSTGMADWQTFVSTKKITDNNFLFFNSSLNNSTKRHPGFKKSLRLFTRVLNTLFVIAHIDHEMEGILVSSCSQWSS